MPCLEEVYGVVKLSPAPEIAKQAAWFQQGSEFWRAFGLRIHLFQ